MWNGAKRERRNEGRDWETFQVARSSSKAGQWQEFLRTSTKVLCLFLTQCLLKLSRNCMTANGCVFAAERIGICIWIQQSARRNGEVERGRESSETRVEVVEKGRENRSRFSGLVEPGIAAGSPVATQFQNSLFRLLRITHFRFLRSSCTSNVFGFGCFLQENNDLKSKNRTLAAQLRKAEETLSQKLDSGFRNRDVQHVEALVKENRELKEQVRVMFFWSLVRCALPVATKLGWFWQTRTLDAIISATQSFRSTHCKTLSVTRKTCLTWEEQTRSWHRITWTCNRNLSGWQNTWNCYRYLLS